jgi:hypothetical protein
MKLETRNEKSGIKNQESEKRTVDESFQEHNHWISILGNHLGKEEPDFPPTLKFRRASVRTLTEIPDFQKD